MGELGDYNFLTILDGLSELLGCTNKPFQIEAVRPAEGYYTRRLPISCIAGRSSQEYFLTVPEEDGFLLRAAADCVVDSIERKEVDFWDPHVFSTSGEEVPIDSLAEFYHFRLYKYLVTHFEQTTGIRFDTIDRLSITPYEGESTQGVLAFLPRLDEGEGASLLEMLQVDFGQENCPIFSVRNIKQVRKIFAGAGNGALLLLREDGARGKLFCRGYLLREDALQCPYHVEILGAYQWRMYEGCTPLFNIEFGCCKVYRDSLEEVIDALHKEFEPNDKEIGQIRCVLRAVSRQHHGATLLFLDFQEEVVEERMEKLAGYLRAISIRPLPLEQGAEWLTGLGRIDGAIVVDISTSTVCYIGTLVDGEAAVAGDLSRGSRHNSISALFSSLVTRCQEEHLPDPRAVAAVFSADGGCRVMTASKVAEQMSHALVGSPGK